MTSRSIVCIGSRFPSRRSTASRRRTISGSVGCRVAEARANLALPIGELACTRCLAHRGRLRRERVAEFTHLQDLCDGSVLRGQPTADLLPPGEQDAVTLPRCIEPVGHTRVVSADDITKKAVGVDAGLAAIEARLVPDELERIEPGVGNHDVVVLGVRCVLDRHDQCFVVGEIERPG